MRNLLLSGLLFMVMLSGCGNAGTPTRTNDFVPVTSIKIVPEVTAIVNSKTIAVNTSTPFKLMGNHSGFYESPVTEQITWTSDTPAVADFITTNNNPIRVIGKSFGTAILTATVVINSKTFTTSYTLTVSNATVLTMTISPATPSVATGLTLPLTVSGSFSDGSIQDLTYDATWSSAATGFATVGDTPASKGLVTGVAKGTANITAAFTDVSTVGKSVTVPLTVTDPALLSIAVTPENPSLQGLTKAQPFTATGSYSNGTTADITSKVTWASSQSSIATIVSTTGVATSVTAGTTSISATLLDPISGKTISGKTNLTVTLLTLSISPTPLTLNVGNTSKFTVTATPPGGTPQDVTTSCTWQSSLPNIVTVLTSNDGSVKGTAIGGPVTITATYNGQSVTATVTVQ